MTVAERLTALAAPLRPAGTRLRRALTATANVLRPVGAVLWRVVGPVLRTVTPTGWVVLALGALSLVVSAVLGWQEFTYLGTVLLAAVVLSALFLFGRASYHVLLELTPRRVVVGDRAMGRMLVTNSGQRGLPPSRMELPVGAGVAEFQLPAMKPKEEHEELFAVPTNRRAVIVAGPAESVRGDALGLLRRGVRWTEPVDLFVHPRTVRIAPSAAGLVRDLEGQVSKKITNNDIAFHALRPYVPGDDRRYVHWRTSARIGQLMVRQFEETRRSQLTLIQSVRPEWYASENEFELAVSVTASIAAQVIRDGTQIKVVDESRAWNTPTITSMLDASCRVEPTTGGFPNAREAVRERTKRLAPSSVVMIVAGSAFPVHDFRSIGTLFGKETAQYGVRVVVGAEPSIGSLGGIAMVTVGRLEDLPAVLRKVTA